MKLLGSKLVAYSQIFARIMEKSSSYILRPVPSEAMVINGKAKLVTERLTNHALADEIINKSK